LIRNDLHFLIAVKGFDSAKGRTKITVS